jgi:hypothetical protein
VKQGRQAGELKDRASPAADVEQDKLLAGRPREISGGALVLAASCTIYYIFGLPH